MNFGERLKDLRKQRSLTQSELAEYMCVSKSTIAMYEIGKNIAEFDKLIKISDFFNVSVDYLLCRTDNVNSDAQCDFKTLGERIRKRRLDLNITQSELAKKLNYTSRSSINKIEMGAQDVPINKIFDFANALNCSLPFLLGISENNTSNEEAELLNIFRQLSAEGKEKIKTYAEDISELENYRSRN